MGLVIGFHTEGCHVFFGTALSQRRQDGNALRQADDLLVQLPGFLVGPTARASAGPAPNPRGRVEEFEAGYAILAGGVQDKPVLLPFLNSEKENNVKVVKISHINAASNNYV